MENKKKSIFLIFAPKMRLTKNFLDPVSQNFTKQISKMALPRAGRGFNLKTHQRRTRYLHLFQNGGQFPEPRVVVAPPPMTGIGLNRYILFVALSFVCKRKYLPWPSKMFSCLQLCVMYSLKIYWSPYRR